MSLPKINIDFLQSAPIGITLSATSATAVLPANAEYIGIVVTVPTRFRITPLAQATAIATDPLITPNSEIQVIRIPAGATNLSAILDLSVTPVANQTLSAFRVFEA